MKYILLFGLILLVGCQKPQQVSKTEDHLRPIHDTIGFAQYSWQMDSIYKRLALKDVPNTHAWKMAISPHDDYTYAGKLYHTSLEGVNANTIILIGVAHRARNFKLQDQLIFGSHTHWKSPYGKLPVSSLNKAIYAQLSEESFVVHDSIQELEHSLEAIVPFLHKKNPKLEIVPILVPYIHIETIDGISTELTSVVAKLLAERNLTFGKDVAIVISNDAVHYGTEAWSTHLAPYGTDDIGTAKAVAHDKRIINDYLTGAITMTKVAGFTKETVKASDYKAYKWVWCGRYSVPFGLAFGTKLNEALHQAPLQGTALDYATSIDHELFPVEDLLMGTTAIATQQHWVAYASLKYE